MALNKLDVGLLPIKQSTILFRYNNQSIYVIFPLPILAVLDIDQV